MRAELLLRIGKPLKRYYLTIDNLPLRSWIKIHEADYTYMRRDLLIGNEKYDVEAYHIMYDAYIKEMGLGKIYIKSLELMKKIALLQCDYVITGDRVKLTKSEIQMDKLQSILATNKSKKNMSIEQRLVHLSKWIGSYLDLDKITTRQYLDLLEGIQTESDKIKEAKQNRKNGEKN